MASFSNLFFIALTRVGVKFWDIVRKTSCIPSREIWPEDIQPSGKAATIYILDHQQDKNKRNDIAGLLVEHLTEALIRNLDNGIFESARSPIKLRNVENKV